MLRQKDTKYVFVMLKIKYNFFCYGAKGIQTSWSRVGNLGSCWISMKFAVDIHVSQQMMPNAYGDPLTFPGVISSRQHFGLWQGISKTDAQISIKFGVDIHGL